MTRLHVLALVALLIAGIGRAYAQDWSKLEGGWEGPWYRGMSSGKAHLEIANGAGTLQLSNAESFGDEPHPLSKIQFDGKALSFEARGGGGPMAATLKLNEKGDQMKGMGKYEGFGVRFELQRVGTK
ncbi:MAG TPA: hypothetical protein VFB54_08150 [Burkholderiales bacterium]|nr:hypothetical protein [Burkholderiales bacterium]